MASHQLSNLTRQKLEQLFDMSGGYVLDFSNASFAGFVAAVLGFDPYDRYRGSKAVILRQIWLQEPMADVARLNLELLEYWHMRKLAADEALSPFEERTYAELTTTFGRRSDEVSEASLEFLAKDFGEVDLGALPRELTSQGIVSGRLAEIEKCIEAEAPLAVIFLVGSTLEGLLLELALGHSGTYNSSKAAPRVRGTTKPLNTWTLAELITVSRALGILGEDVLRHADHVRKPQLHSSQAAVAREFRA